MKPSLPNFFDVDEEDVTVDGANESFSARSVTGESTDDETTDGCSAARLEDSFPSVSVRFATTAVETSESLFEAKFPIEKQHLNNN